MVHRACRSSDFAQRGKTEGMSAAPVDEFNLVPEQMDHGELDSEVGA